MLEYNSIIRDNWGKSTTNTVKLVNKRNGDFPAGNR